MLGKTGTDTSGGMPNTAKTSTPKGESMKKTCKRGHEFTPENTRMRGNARICRQCDADRKRREYHEDQVLPHVRDLRVLSGGA